MRTGLVLLVLLGCAACSDGQSTGEAPGVADFLSAHWQRPLAPQGLPPAHFSALEASLAPQDCGACHSAQYHDWQQSLHSQTMSAGLRWQLRLLPQQEANSCLDCHAPLAEQKALIAREHEWSAAPASPPPDYVPASLGHQGLVCAACHVRAHQRFGPPTAQATVAGAPHDGFTPAQAYRDSRFCASCHQFEEDGPRTNGKLREDTLQQWAASDYAARGEQCQSCHMPDGAHRWRGIHDPDMVRQALQVEAVRDGSQVLVTLTNAGAGHHLPTYMVPKIRVQLLWPQRHGAIPLAEYVIGWDVDVALQVERFDTRLPAGASHRWRAALPLGTPADAALEIGVQVAPREHYERMFQSMLAQAEALDATTLSLLQQAHDEALATRFDALRVPVAPQQ